MFGLQKKSLHIKVTLSLVGVLLLAWLAVGSGVASAHADRLVDSKYGFRVGFLNEPAYSGLVNGVDLSICRGTCHANSDGSGQYINPVTEPLLYQNITVTVVYGGSQLALPITPVFQHPGKFSATFIPTAAGNYTFRFTGKIGSDKIDESFNSAKDGFDAVQDVQTIQFPNKLPLATSPSNAIQATISAIPTSATQAATNATTSGSVAAISSTVATTNSGDLQNQLASTSQQLQTTQSQLAQARNSADAATTFAVIGIIVGLVAVVVAVVALLRNGSNRVELG